MSRPLGRAGRTLLQVPVGPWLGVCRHWQEDRRIGAHTPLPLSLAGLGWQVRRGSHGLLGPNSPRPFLFSSSRERVPLPALWNCCPCVSSHRGSILETSGPEKPLPARSLIISFPPLLVRKWFPLPFHAWRPGIWCSTFQLTFVLPLSCLSVVHWVPSQSPTWTCGALLGSSSVVSDKPMTFPCPVLLLGRTSLPFQLLASS